MFIQVHFTPPLDLFLNFGRLFTRHYKLVLTFTGGVMDVKLFFLERSSYFGSVFGGINVFIQKHSTPPLNLFLNFGRLFTRHHKLVLIFTGEVMDNKLFFFERSSFLEVSLEV